MWLLNTSNAELKFFSDPSRVPYPGICILSHTWAEAQDETTFKDLKRIRRKCKRTRENPRNRVSEKIRKCCELAEQDGYAWVWIDTCCINKDSSAEVSEAINSMFSYYSLSSVCYVYLADVPGDRNPFEPPVHNRFTDSRWHRRGWTLQELIAPDTVLFFSQDWTFLGTKADLAQSLTSATRIPAALLRGDAELSDFSVAQRMSWAADRETSRKEDEAYSLLGIFDINMPTLYGEGANAFYRLQEEIIRRSPDTTIFAWNLCMISVSDPDVDEESQWPLLADSPKHFKNESQNITFGSVPDPQYRGETHDFSYKDHTSFTLTPHGVLARVPLTVVNNVTLIDLDWYTQNPSRPGRIYLLLTSSGTANSIRNLWHVSGSSYQRSVAHVPTYLKVNWSMQELYISCRSNKSRKSGETLFPCNRSAKAPFHFRIEQSDHIVITRVLNLTNDWTGVEPAVLDVRSEALQFHLTFGACKPLRREDAAGSGVPGAHWIRACLGTSTGCFSCKGGQAHSCRDDHIAKADLGKVYFAKARSDFSGLSNNDVFVCKIDFRLHIVQHPWAANTLVVKNVQIHQVGRRDILYQAGQDLMFPQTNVTLKAPLSHALDLDTNRVLLHTDNPFPVDIAGPPILQDGMDGRSVFLGSAVLGFGQTMHPCRIVVENGAPKVIVLGYPGEVEHYGYYYLLAFDKQRMHWISQRENGPIVSDSRPVIGGWDGHTNRKVFHARTHSFRGKNGHYVGYLTDGIDLALIEWKDQLALTYNFEILYWRAGEEINSTSQHSGGSRDVQIRLPKRPALATTDRGDLVFKISH